MRNSLENFGESSEQTQSNNPAETAENTAEKDAKRSKLNDLQQRLTDLEAWTNSWTPADRSLAKQLESQIAQLKKELE